MLKQFLTFAVIVLLGTLGGCSRGEGDGTPGGPEQHETRSVDLDKSESVRVELKLPVGELDVRGGAQKLMEGDFSYNVPEWKPDIRYNSLGAMGDLVVEQHGSSSSHGNKEESLGLAIE